MKKVTYKNIESYILDPLDQNDLKIILSYKQKFADDSTVDLSPDDNMLCWYKTHNTTFLCNDHGVYYDDDGANFYKSVDYYYKSNRECVKLCKKRTVFCKCGCNEFELDYGKMGSYNLDGICVNCGLTSSVYSG